MSDLLPCPFCGAAAFDAPDEPSPAGRLWSVQCEGCSACVQDIVGQEAAWAAWNRRAAPAGYVVVPKVATEPELIGWLETLRVKLASRSDLGDAEIVYLAANEIVRCRAAAMVAAGETGETT